MGIEETMKLLNVLEGDLINLLHVDYSKVRSEIKDVDFQEGIELAGRIGKAILTILSLVQSRNNLLLTEIASLKES